MAMEIDSVQTSTSTKGMGDMPETSWSHRHTKRPFNHYFIPPRTHVLVMSQIFGSFNAHKVILQQSAVFRKHLEDYPNTTILYMADLGQPGTIGLVQYLYTGRLPYHQRRVGSHHYAAFTLYFAADAHNLPEMKQQARAQLLHPDVGLINKRILDTVANYYYYEIDRVGIEQLRKEVIHAHALRWHNEFSRDTVEYTDIMKELMHEFPAFSEDYTEGVTRGLETLDAERALGRMTL